MQKIAFSGFAWDKANHSKCQKHGVSVAEVEHVLAHAATVIVPDIKNSRRAALPGSRCGRQKGRYTFVVFTPRQTGSRMLVRPISARYMHRKEIEKYEQEIARVQNR